MLLSEIVTKLGLDPVVENNQDKEITSGYASDLLSDVLAKGKQGMLWVTNQKHQNIIGVAVMLDLAGVVIAGGLMPDENTRNKAAEENIPLYTTDTSMFDLAGKLYEFGVRSS